jgi:hypothetical protein
MSAKKIGVEETSTVLLDATELAARLSVRPSWVREKVRGRARERDSDPLPCVRLGKYTRFRWTDVEVWLARQIDNGPKKA